MVNATAKGTRVEREVTKTLQALGLEAYRLPLSGNGLGGGDVMVKVGSRRKIFEVKARASGFSQLYGWLSNCDGLVVKADRHEPLVIMRLADVRDVLFPEQTSATTAVEDPGQ